MIKSTKIELQNGVEPSNVRADTKLGEVLFKKSHIKLYIKS